MTRYTARQRMHEIMHIVEKRPDNTDTYSTLCAGILEQLMGTIGTAPAYGCRTGPSGYIGRPAGTTTLLGSYS
jgi:hypothetical protein